MTSKWRPACLDCVLEAEELLGDVRRQLEARHQLQTTHVQQADTNIDLEGSYEHIVKEIVSRISWFSVHVIHYAADNKNLCLFVDRHDEEHRLKLW
jgi:hypothetical protein